MLRTQLAGQGIHFLVYVDDFLVVGDTLEKTLIKGMRALEELLDVLGLQWALHKRRGPARALEFLGILIANLPDLEGRPLVAVGEKRRQRMLTLFESWLARRSPPPTPWSPSPKRLEVAPKEMAELLGLLVFIAPCIPKAGYTCRPCCALLPGSQSTGGGAVCASSTGSCKIST